MQIVRGDAHHTIATMIEQPSAGRAKIYRDGDTIEITIASKKNWFSIIFLTAWLGVWFMGEFSALERVFNQNTDTTPISLLIFWLVGWTMGGLLIIVILLWFIGGEEIITVDNGVLELGRQIFGLGPIKLYQITDIKQMTVSPTRDKDQWGNSRGRYLIKSGLIEFDYGLKTIKFGGEFDLAEARALVATFKLNKNFTETNFR